MVYVTANELKKKGVSLFDNVLPGEGEAIITVRGQNKYVVIDIDAYNRYREFELEVALAQSKKDLVEGNFIEESVEEHIKRLKNEI